MSTSGQDRRIDYVEFNVRDIARAKAFYGGAFGWRFCCAQVLRGFIKMAVLDEDFASTLLPFKVARCECG